MSSRHRFPFLFFLPFFFFLSLSLFLGILYIFKGIIYKTFCLLNVFLFVTQFFISMCCDVPRLDFFFKNYMLTVDCFCFLNDTDTHLCY